MAVVVVLGCGGVIGQQQTGEVSGVITTLDLDVVRGARVVVETSGETRETASNSGGAYVIRDVPEGDVIVTAEVFQSGVRYVGRNVARVFADERTQSVNLTMGRADRLAVMEGVVYDLSGNRVEGARVFANAGTLGSSMDITDRNGEYRIEAMLSGVDYNISAGAQGFSSDLATATLNANETRRVDFTLGSAGSPTLSPPQNLAATAWTTPEVATRATDASEAVQAIKALVKPGYKPVATTALSGRDTIDGDYVEVDLAWDPMPSQSLLGFGVYRALGTFGSFEAVDFLRDPETGAYVDLDPRLKDLQTYQYRITALNTLYPETGNSESAPSDIATIRPIGSISSVQANGTSLAISWDSSAGAEDYIVFVFSQYPGIGVNPVWTSSRTTLTSLTYTGPATPSARYFVMVVAAADGDSSLAISPVGDFVVN